jgi:hypothetical protein
MQRQQRNRYLTIFCLSAPAAAIVWFVFRGVDQDLTRAVRAVGYVDSMTQMGIALGYVAMVGGTLIFASIAAWSLFAYLRLLLRDR